jgi:hypothetical protein
VLDTQGVKQAVALALALREMCFWLAFSESCPSPPPHAASMLPIRPITRVLLILFCIVLSSISLRKMLVLVFPSDPAPRILAKHGDRTWGSIATEKGSKCSAGNCWEKCATAM